MSTNCNGKLSQNMHMKDENSLQMGDSIPRGAMIAAEQKEARPDAVSANCTSAEGHAIGYRCA
jgi:hypothetical protein